MFEPLNNYIFKATEKYKLTTQAKASMICQRSRNVIESDFPNFQKNWIPEKYEKNILTISCKTSSSASNLYIKSHVLIEKINQQELPEKIYEIKIMRN